MKMLIVGDSTYKIYAFAFYKAAQKRKDVEADIFDFGELNTENIRNNLLKKIEVHYKNGFMVNRLNCKLLKICSEHEYDMIFLYSCSLIYASTVKKLTERGLYVSVFCNDNPFSEYYKKYTWKHLIASARYANMVYVYRKSNIEDYKKQGIKKIKVLLPYYIKERNYYIPDDQIEMDVPEIIFIGHMENDDRKEYIKVLLDESIPVGVNHAWSSFEYRNDNLHVFSQEIATAHYNELINKAKIAIVFLSRLNGDTYTRRCFEIPAAKTMMIAPYTDDLAKMYKEDEEIVFYRNTDEFVKKIKYYLSHPTEREKIAISGYERLIKSKNEVGDRLDQILNDYMAYFGRNGL